ncbi:hypothetical protein XBJ1_2795 [Xenorhabdus bovienii SS-2004]|uniref:Uncharacterized protein n=1 Tax=Xenorhabdus bovienii (strain SS-2004) TaxID=406818 RepID=D3V7V7_XENBS|nr:hypothetical protein XBJ1_2795 [Xenorhabdus bovienii SS-2004]
MVIKRVHPPPLRALAPPPRPHTKRACFCAVVHRRGDLARTGLGRGSYAGKNCAILRKIVMRFYRQKTPVFDGRCSVR